MEYIFSTLPSCVNRVWLWGLERSLEGTEIHLNKFSNAVLFRALKKHCSRYETYCYGCCQKCICKVYSTDYKVGGYTSQETRTADISVFSLVRPVNFSQSKFHGNRLCGCIIDYRIVQSFPSFLTKIDDGFTTKYMLYRKTLSLS